MNYIHLIIIKIKKKCKKKNQIKFFKKVLLKNVIVKIQNALNFIVNVIKIKYFVIIIVIVTIALIILLMQ